MGRLDDIVERNRYETEGPVGRRAPLDVSSEAPPPGPRFQLPSQQKTTSSPLAVIAFMIFAGGGIALYVYLRFM